jgi:hypothetical protein
VIIGQSERNDAALRVATNTKPHVVAWIGVRGRPSAANAPVCATSCGEKFQKSGFVRRKNRISRMHIPQQDSCDDPNHARKARIAKNVRDALTACHAAQMPKTQKEKHAGVVLLRLLLTKARCWLWMIARKICAGRMRRI